MSHPAIDEFFFLVTGLDHSLHSEVIRDRDKGEWDESCIVFGNKRGLDMSQ